MKHVLVEYTVRVFIESDGHPSNEVMDDALRTWEATAEHKGRAPNGDNRMNITRCLSGFVDNIDSLGEVGFKVEVIKDDLEPWL